MKIAILGGAGYIGSFLCEAFPGHDVAVYDLGWFGELPESYRYKFQKCDYSLLMDCTLRNFDVIILLAGHSSVQMCENNLGSSFHNNVSNFVELIQKISPSQIFIYASSSSVYGTINAQDATEECQCYVPNTFYDTQKAEIDYYARLSNLNYYGLRFGTVNGPSPNFRNDTMINAMVFNGLKNGKVKVFNPHVRRPILDIFDLSHAIKAIIEKADFRNRGIYNLASFNSTSKLIGEGVANILNCDLEIVEPPQGTQATAYDFTINCDKIYRNFGVTLNGSIPIIVQRILNWDKNHLIKNFQGRREARLY